MPKRTMKNKAAFSKKPNFKKRSDAAANKSTIPKIKVPAIKKP